jgi:hypothetical protein
MDVRSQLHAPAALHPRKDPRYPLERRLDAPQSRSGRGGEEKSSSHCENRTPVVQLVD